MAVGMNYKEIYEQLKNVIRTLQNIRRSTTDYVIEKECYRLETQVGGLLIIVQDKLYNLQLGE